MEQNNAEMKKQEREQVVELGSDVTKSKRGNIYTLTIIGQVEGHMIAPETVKTTKYEHVLPLLAGIEESDEIDGLLLLLNTVGGDIEAGLAIAEMIAGMKKPTVSLVLGGGQSIGVPLAVANVACELLRLKTPPVAESATEVELASFAVTLKASVSPAVMHVSLMVSMVGGTLSQEEMVICISRTTDPMSTPLRHSCMRMAMLYSPCRTGESQVRSPV